MDLGVKGGEVQNAVGRHRQIRRDAKMAFWSNWSDGTKWLMGILSALIIAALIGGFRILLVPGNSPVSSPNQTKKSDNPAVARRI